jgi:hypothetical protein
LFAALEIATGKVTDENYHTHKHAEVNGWLARNPGTTLHFTPTSGSRLNLVEVFFGIITRQAIRRGSFDNVKELIATIRALIAGWNIRYHPFTRRRTGRRRRPRRSRGSGRSRASDGR